MGLEKIRQSVLSEAKAEATRMIGGVREKNAGFLKAQKEAGDQGFERLYRLRIQTIEEEYSRKLIQFQGAAGKEVLDKRNGLLKSLFEKTRKEILAWPRERYAKVMGRFIEKAAGSDEGKIRVHREEREVFEKVLSEVNKARGGARITIDPGDSLPERGGFVFVSAGFEVDYTLGTMLKQIEYELLPTIASELFQG
jgi:vacuolar-type H+-ATPase subunit E/Vma4